jgi:WD40 repeat protein
VEFSAVETAPVVLINDWQDHLALPHCRETRRWWDGCGVQSRRRPAASLRGSEVSGSEGMWIATWSADGKYLTASSEDGHQLLLFDFKTKKWSELVKTLFGDAHFSIYAFDWRH